ncbi:MAG: PilZ domain-containing protein [Phycisphaerales bacterium]
MSRWTAIAKMIDDQGKPESRVKPRFVARHMKCNDTSEVLDFSASGIRVLYIGKPAIKVGDQLELSLKSDVGVHRGLAIVKRVSKVGFRKWEVGFMFADPEAAKQMQLFKCGYSALDDGQWSAA